MTRWQAFWSALDVKGGPLMGAFTILVLGGGAVAICLRFTGQMPGADIPDGLVRCYQAAVMGYAGSRALGPVLARYGQAGC